MNVQTPPLPYPPPPSGSGPMPGGGFTRSVTALPYPSWPPQAEMEQWLAASGVTVVQRGDRYILGSRGSNWGVMDLQTRDWMGWFDGPMARSHARVLWDQLENHGIAFWRRAKALWITLHVILGLIGMGFLTAVFASVLATVVGVDPERMGSHGLPVALAYFGPAAGWLLFVYLRKPNRVRVTVLAASAVLGVGGWLLSIGPSIPGSM